MSPLLPTSSKLFEPVDELHDEYLQNMKARCGDEFCHCAESGTYTLEIDEGHVIVRHRECGRRLFDEAVAILQMAAVRVDIQFVVTHTAEVDYDAEGIISIPGASHGG